MSQARVLLFGLAAVYLVGVVAQFFLAGLGTFGATDFDPHRALGLGLALLSLLLLLLASAGKVPKRMLAIAALLFVLNVVQLVLAQVEVEEIAALHVVNALVVAYVGLELVQRSRRFVASKMNA